MFWRRRDFALSGTTESSETTRLRTEMADCRAKGTQLQADLTACQAAYAKSQADLAKANSDKASETARANLLDVKIANVKAQVTNPLGLYLGSVVLNILK